MLIQHRLEVQLTSLIIEKLKEYELHFYLQKNDMLDTEYRLANIWTMTTVSTPDLHFKSLAN
ncbi:hypothetical protein H6G54_12570 [Anabaena cylindrica FACHB-243]|uniref:Uncharacterized protein n=1 Tax=Anabaena cylindrica (strain ATCC 27899 / PCC 7122) TaxID=272123 RepID=K9ZFR0_ANACC|nr:MULTISPECIES: hypothetical protein [Anabaena]AFZ57579.1 hypothetical protein Anacy_2103 [Anabaena cylindrica PCC 7122]MBD2418516.1 hypothetical protein [Anabaena cylindrica FACHB-243]MBY5284980.1 hypothetical protein [Anabaena sp. CCAP 1446/1C]MBY5307260.1 hypothetical protein [Anabaena sp. CCAP 1446/1C]MCM2405056.1 hypothetical protein [Anabaena sp. CCAP 1446/1C]